VLGAIWRMKAPMHTAPTTNQRYDASRAMARSGGGSRPLSTASRSAAIEAGPGDESVTSGPSLLRIVAVLVYSVRRGLSRVSTRLVLSSLELVDLAHERRGDGGVQLAVEEQRPVGPGQQRRQLLQIVQRADGRRLEAEGLGDRRVIDVREHRLRHRQVAHLAKVKIHATGTPVHQRNDPPHTRAHTRLHLAR